MTTAYSSYSYTEENYLKAIYKLSEISNGNVSTNAISERLNTKPASVTDMIRKLNNKGLLKYEKYQGVILTRDGKNIAKHIIRKHRLWEYFLVKKLNLKWDQVHEIAEQLEHIKSKLLIDEMDRYLGYPSYDPHGDPIPDSNGSLRRKHKHLLYSLNKGSRAVIVGVKDHSNEFLQYLDKLNLSLGKEIKILDKIEYDKSMHIELDRKIKLTISQKVTENLFVEKYKK